jgi:hypothetical protein
VRSDHPIGQKTKGRSFWAPAFEFSPRTWPFCAVTFFYGLFDRVDLTVCHEISGIIAVHNKQFNVVWRKSLAGSILLVCASAPVLAATMAQPSKPDPLLDSGPTSACAAAADYAAGTDANGQAVVPADVAAGRVPLPDSVAIPLTRGPMARGGRHQHPANPQTLGGDSTYVSLDGKKLEPLLNPPPCAETGR